jgi:hypothetical protein
MSKYARSNSGRDTVYQQFHTPHSARAGLNSDSIIDADTGKSPISRWLAFVLSFDEAVSVPTVGMVYDCQLPPNTLVLSAMVRKDTAFVGTGTDDVDVGDTDDPNGWLDGIDLSAALTTAGVPVWLRDVDAGYMAYSDIVKGTSGPQYYPAGVIRVIAGSADDFTAGEAILFLETISYNEAINAEA